MNFHAMTDSAITMEVGRRIEQLRLEQNRTQQEVADAVGLSRISYAQLEKGKSKFVNIIAVLRTLDRLDLIGNFIPETTFSPMERLKMQGRQRQRATGSRKQNNEQAAPDKEIDW